MPEDQHRKLVSHLVVLEQFSFTFIELVLRAGRLRDQAKLLSPGAISDYERDEIAAVFTGLETESEALGLVDTRDLATRARSLFQEGGKEYGRAELHKDLDTVLFSFEKGLRRQVFFRIPLQKQAYFQQDALFGAKVAEAFPSAGDNIERAGTCFALVQDDACVFHAMRVLESGLRVIAAKVGVDFEHKNWANVIDQVEAAVTKGATVAGVDVEERKVYAQAAVHFRFVKDAWRNEVMHSGAVYDSGTALSILNHVREFTQALADAGLSDT